MSDGGPQQVHPFEHPGEGKRRAKATPKGRQIDPKRVRRDLWHLQEWEQRRMRVAADGPAGRTLSEGGGTGDRAAQ